MADYLLRARPATAARTLFVTVKAPSNGLATSSITGVVTRACVAAGMPYFGPHRIRHAVACDLLAADASMEERPVAVPRPAAHDPDLCPTGPGPTRRAAHALPTGSRPISIRLRVEEYLALHRPLGFKLHVEGRMPRNFADQLDDAGHRTVTVEAAVAWASQPSNVVSSMHSTRRQTRAPLAPSFSVASHAVQLTTF
jgi:hypothetical protein